ncbi:MAG: hypothetical protein OEW58_10320 [Gammaproteobacteria bacterium]|nr:hypothetical protein [Gammaproteobacteria bacterium]
MQPRIVDPNRFLLMGGMVDWDKVYRQNISKSVPSAKEIAMQRKLPNTRVIQLRWVLDPLMGYPTEPFKVWIRPSMPMETEQPLSYELGNMLLYRVAVWEKPQAGIRATFQSSAPGSVLAYSGAPLASPLVDMVSLSVGTREVRLTGAAIQCLVFTSNSNLIDLVGNEYHAADAPGWTLLEHVGLPVDQEQWAGVYDLDAKQGFANALTSPVLAARQRFLRGAPFYGWQSEMAPGYPAPPWQLADDQLMIELMQKRMLPDLKSMIVNHVPKQQWKVETSKVMQDAGGGSNPASAKYSPLQTLMLGACTDTLASLVSGFGTAYADYDIESMHFGKISLFNNPNRCDFDFMVTARYEGGISGKGQPQEYAAILLAPSLALPPPLPSNLTVATDGHRAPDVVDQPWMGIARVGWDKICDALPFRVASYAFARAGVNPASGTQPLMNPRPDDVALQPISATTSFEQEQATARLGALDDGYSIASIPNPNTVLYGLAHQNLFGMWSAWSTITHTIGEPDAQRVSLLSARLDTGATSAGGITAGTLIIELSWNWEARSLKQFEIVGRMYPQAKRNDPPPSLAVPAGLRMSLAGGAGVPFKIVFNSNAVGIPDSGTIQYVSIDGKTLQASASATPGVRRYRITIPGFSLNFNTSGHIGLALWARGQEMRMPQRHGQWSSQPLVTSASDPRPPVMVIEHENVLLTSMPDARGEHHAQLAWSATSGSTGYYIYTTTETKFRADNGMGDPPYDQTLSQRLAALRAKFATHPSRRSFTRLNETAISGLSTNIRLPRGTKDIHMYVILGTSAGQVESPWPALGEPNLGKRFIGYAAPQISQPHAPDLEVARVLDSGSMTYQAKLKIRSKPASSVSRTDIYRVRVAEAALELDTMGAPIASVSSSDATWTVAADAVDVSMRRVEGLDAVEGSWKRVFYRAVNWGAEDLSRGLYPGRSQPSAVREVIVPPASPPSLSEIEVSWPGGSPADVLAKLVTLAPIVVTPLGPHRLKVDVMQIDALGQTTSLYSFPAPGDDNTLSDVSTTPPAPSDSGLWSESGATPVDTQLNVLIKRTAVDCALKIRVFLTDPLGRATEKLLDVGTGSLIVSPDISNVITTKMGALGHLLRFDTSVPVVPPPVTYTLQVSVRRGIVLFPWFFGGFTFYLSPVTVNHSLYNLAPLPGGSLFSAAENIPVRRSVVNSQLTRVTLALRWSRCRVTLKLTGPDGNSASYQTTLS